DQRVLGDAFRDAVGTVGELIHDLQAGVARRGFVAVDVAGQPQDRRHPLLDRLRLALRQVRVTKFGGIPGNALQLGRLHVALRAEQRVLQRRSRGGTSGRTGDDLVAVAVDDVHVAVHLAHSRLVIAEFESERFLGAGYVALVLRRRGENAAGGLAGVGAVVARWIGGTCSRSCRDRAAAYEQRGGRYSDTDPTHGSL